TVVSATLPTGTGPEGYGRGTASVNAVTMLRSDFGKRFTYEGSLGFGVTPTHGRLAEFQRSAFVLIAQGLRGRVAGPLALYANVIWHSTVYRNIGTSELDAADLTTDVGGFLKFRGLPEIILGLTEDLKPSSPAIDLSFRVGARW
ncbi:MAG TPA: hypothetical protein VLD58_10635, partial [Gemmatimonadales bacterium]|nr:hypothetical protein [Gemmatimonadales bacterium]